MGSHCRGIRESGVIWMAEATAVETPELRAAVAAGDRDAFGAMFEANHERVLRFLRARCDRALAEDLAQATWLRALQNLHQWRDQGRPFVAWLLTIAGNLLADHYKSAYQRRCRLVADFADPDSPTLVESADVEQLAISSSDDDRRVRLWRKAFASLTARQREVLVLRVVEGLSVRETARKLGVEEGAVKAAAYRAYQTLRSSSLVRGLWDDLRDGGDA